MNILFTPSDNNRLSGAFLSMVKLTSILKNKYHHNVLVVLPYEGDGTALLEAEGVRNIVIRSYGWTVPQCSKFKVLNSAEGFVKKTLTKRNISTLAKLINEENIDIVHINTSYSYIGALAALKTDTPFVWHIREFLEEDQRRTMYRQKQAYNLMRRANRVVAISDSIYDKYSKILGSDRISVIYNGIDPGNYLDEQHIIFNKSSLKFLMVGRLEEGKEQWQAIQACIKLRKKCNLDFKLSIVGKGTDDSRDYVKSLEKMVSDAGAQDYIEFCGAQNDTPKFYKESDIFIICSRAEAFGRVTVEAMLGGCLVIGARAAGTKDVVRDRETGLLYESGSVDDLLAKIEFSIDHIDESKIMAKRGQQFMLANMTADINAERINQLYAEIREGAKRY